MLVVQRHTIPYVLAALGGAVFALPWIDPRLWPAAWITFNALAGTNYLYVSHKPPSMSILDLLGDWPYYVVAEVLVIAVLWSLMTVPWMFRGRGRAAD